MHTKLTSPPRAALAARCVGLGLSVSAGLTSPCEGGAVNPTLPHTPSALCPSRTSPTSGRGSSCSQAIIKRTYALIEQAVLKGERCPRNMPYGPLSGEAITPLHRAGRIRIELFRGNYRVVTLTSGPHAGRSTAPYPGGGKPWKVIP